MSGEHTIKKKILVVNYGLCLFIVRQQLKEELLSTQPSINDTDSCDQAPAGSSLDSDNAQTSSLRQKQQQHAPAVTLTNHTGPHKPPRMYNNKRHIDYLLARNLDSVLLKSLEENNILCRSGDTLMLSVSRTDSTVVDDVTESSPSPLETQQMETVIDEEVIDTAGKINCDIKVNDVTNDVTRGTVIANKRSLLLHTSCLDIDTCTDADDVTAAADAKTGERICDSNELQFIDHDLEEVNAEGEGRRYSSVDVPGIIVHNCPDDGDYSLLPNGMLVLNAAAAAMRPLKHGSSEHNRSKQRPLPLKIRNQLRDTVSNKFAANQTTASKCDHNSSSRTSRSGVHARVGGAGGQGHGAAIARQQELDCDENGIESTASSTTAIDINSRQAHATAPSNESLLEPGAAAVVAAAGPREAGDKRKSSMSMAEKFSKDELYMMWKVSENELKKKLDAATRQNQDLLEKLAQYESS